MWVDMFDMTNVWVGVFRSVVDPSPKLADWFATPAGHR